MDPRAQISLPLLFKVDHRVTKDKLVNPQFFCAGHDLV